MCYRDSLVVGDARGNTAICTLWMRRDLLGDLPKGSFSLIGNLTARTSSARTSPLEWTTPTANASSA